MAQRIKRLPAMQETRVQSLGREDPLEEEMATHCSHLAWRIPMDRGAWQATVHGVTKSRTQLGDFTFFLSFLKITFLKKVIFFKIFLKDLRSLMIYNNSWQTHVPNQNCT